MARVTSYLLPSSLKRENEALAASLQVPYCEKVVDDFLIGHFQEEEEEEVSCFSQLEVFDDETFKVIDLEQSVDNGSYLELIHINGKSSHLPQHIYGLTVAKGRLILKTAGNLTRRFRTTWMNVGPWP
jgi:hypothetical protein